MSSDCYLAVVCDADPDHLPPYRKLPPGVPPDSIWHGLTDGVPALRRALDRSTFTQRHGQLPITWLLRSDRQILEIYEDAAFCYGRFMALWDHERSLGSTLGWHPHLYRWNDEAGKWDSYLHRGDEIEILETCLAALREQTPIRVVRTGWDYHSNTLMRLFDSSGLVADASPIPGSVQIGGWWTHDWEGTPRVPYHPSVADYRRPANPGEERLRILVLPTLVRELPLPQQLVRHLIRRWRARRSQRAPSWGSARWRGQFITRMPQGFRAAARDWLERHAGAPVLHLVTYFHPDEILPAQGIRSFVENLEYLARVADRFGFRVVPVTLEEAARHVPEIRDG